MPLIEIVEIDLSHDLMVYASRGAHAHEQEVVCIIESVRTRIHFLTCDVMSTSTCMVVAVSMYTASMERASDNDYVSGRRTNTIIDNTEVKSTNCCIRQSISELILICHHRAMLLPACTRQKWVCIYE